LDRGSLTKFTEFIYTSTVKTIAGDSHLGGQDFN
jgi:hypothetical protein